MVERIGRLFARKVSGVHIAAYVLGSFTVLSSFLALLRDRLLATVFGAGADLDLYYAAFRIPDLLYISVGSLVSVSVLVPLLAEKSATGGRESEQVELSRATSFFAIAIVGAAALVWLVLPYIAPHIFIGFSGEMLEQLVSLSRILLLSPVLLGFSNVFGSVTQLSGRFLLYAISPLLYNAGIIIGIIGFVPLWGIRGVVYGVVMGAVFHIVPQALFVYKEKLWPQLTRLSFTYIRTLVSLSVPRTVALSMSHIVLLLLIASASTLAAGTIAVFSFSYNLQSVIVSVIGVSYSLAAFSSLSKYAAERDWVGYKNELTSSLRQLVFWSIPSVVLLVVLRAQIVRTVLGAGAFSWADTRLTAASLAIFAVATLFQSMNLLFTRAYYARGETRIPLGAYVVGSLVSLLAAWQLYTSDISGSLLLLARILKVDDLDARVLVLSAAFAIGSCVTWIGLVLIVYVRQWVSMSIRFVCEMLVSAAVMGYATYYGLILFGPLFGTQTLLGIFSQGLLAGLLGIVASGVTLWFVGNTDVQDAVFFISKRLRTYGVRKQNVPLPTSDITDTTL